ncbi:MAG: hypothetical protein AAF296_13995 [Pseudomonadota bacterium]
MVIRPLRKSAKKEQPTLVALCSIGHFGSKAAIEGGPQSMLVTKTDLRLD